MGVDLGSLIQTLGTMQEARNEWKIRALEEQRLRDVQDRDFALRQQEANAQEAERRERGQYLEGRNATSLQAVRERLAALQTQREAEAQQRAADAAERSRHNQVMEKAALDRVAAIRAYHRETIKGDPLPRQIRTAALDLYRQFSKSPGRDVYGQQLPEPSGDVVDARVRHALRGIYGNVVDVVLPPPVPPPGSQRTTASPSDALAGYRRDMQAALKLHQQALDAGHSPPEADQALTQVDRALHLRYGLTRAGTPPNTPLPGANGTTPRTALTTPPAAGMTLRPTGQGAAPISGIAGTGGFMDQFTRTKMGEAGAAGGVRPQQPAGPAYTPPLQPPRPPAFSPAASAIMPPPQPVAPLASAFVRPEDEPVDEDDYGTAP